MSDEHVLAIIAAIIMSGDPSYPGDSCIEDAEDLMDRACYVIANKKTD